MIYVEEEKYRVERDVDLTSRIVGVGKDFFIVFLIIFYRFRKMEERTIIVISNVDGLEGLNRNLEGKIVMVDEDGKEEIWKNNSEKDRVVRK